MELEIASAFQMHGKSMKFPLTIHYGIGGYLYYSYTTHTAVLATVPTLLTVWVDDGTYIT